MATDKTGRVRADSKKYLPALSQKAEPSFQPDDVWGGVLKIRFVTPDGKVSEAKVGRD